MPIFDSPSALHDEAHALYREGKHPAAAMTWARAREAARTLGDQAEAFKASYWEADAWRNHGELRRALGLLLSLRTEVPPEAPALILWYAHTSALIIQTDLRPELARLRRMLADLEALALRQPHPAADVHFHRGELHSLRGAWAEALDSFSRGWQAREYDSGGWAKYSFACQALPCCLRLGRRQEAESWWQHWSTTNQDWGKSRQLMEQASLHLALEACDLAATRNCVENGCGSPGAELRGRLFLRADSQDAIDDPADPTHPARKLAASERKESVLARYDNLLALLDYRLACLRFSAGLPAVDDLYYRQPDAIPTRLKVTERAKLQAQLRHFRLTWHLLRYHARRIDALLESDWRTKEADSRWNRAAAIATACNAELKPHT